MCGHCLAVHREVSRGQSAQLTIDCDGQTLEMVTSDICYMLLVRKCSDGQVDG